MEAPFTGVVMAGGCSRRMGSDKALIVACGKTLIEGQAQTLEKAGANEVVISCRHEQPYGGFGYPLVFDEFPDRGPIGGISSALSHAQNPWICVLAVDLPKLPSEYLMKLFHRCGKGIGAIPRWNGRFEPLAAFYPQSALPLVSDRIMRGLFSLQALVDEGIRQNSLLAVPVLAHEERFFDNWNSPEAIEEK
jgi:molybdopterin-guanine dinucleotide biosynthesis protein A